MRSCGQTSAVASPISLLSLPGMFHQEIIKPIFLGFIMRKKTLLLLAEYENGL